MNDSICYIIEYTHRTANHSKQLVTVETINDVHLYIQEHHKMTQTVYLTWYPDLQWTPKRDEYDIDLNIDKDDIFTDDTTGKQYIPISKKIYRYWYQEPCMPGYVLGGYEDYTVYCIRKEFLP